jgi:hypothetical protein
VRKFAAVFVAFGLALLPVASASAATPSLPTTTVLDGLGLQEMLRISGNISVSIDGAGYASGFTALQTGTIRAEKPSAGAKVVAAYLTAAVMEFVVLADPPNRDAPAISLDAKSVTFTHSASVLAQRYAAFPGYSGEDLWFHNFFADVTSLVKPTIDNAGQGIINLNVDEGPRFNRIDGTSLLVVFEEASQPGSSVVVMFGTSKPEGDSFGVNFPALTNLAQQQATLSLGIAYGCQVYSTDPNNNCRMRNESSVIELSTSSQPLQNLSLTAGGFDDGKLAFGALITVGGVGDSRDVPNLAATLPPTNQEEFDASNDDELYGLDTFLRPGDTSLTISSRNATLDDNIFQAVLFFEGVAVEGATAVTLSDDNSGQTEDTSGSSSGAGAGAGAGAGSGGSGSTGSTHSAPAIHLNLEAKPGDSASGAPVVTGGQGLKPGSTYTLILREPAVSLRSGVVEGSGGFTFRDSLPAGLAPGSYTITLTAVGADGSTLILTQSFTIAADGTFSVVGPVTGKVTPTLASTGLDGPLALGVTSVGAFLLLLGAMLVLARRRAEVTQ